jgi:hypothetical protein
LNPDALQRFLKKWLPFLSLPHQPQVEAGGRGKSREREAVSSTLGVVSGRIELYFGDESTFSMVACLPSGWSPKGERVEIFPQRDQKVNLCGMFRPDNFCVTYESKGNINSRFLIDSIDDFCRYVDKPTALVIDNAPTHRSQMFPAQLERWREKGLNIFFLPRYSPDLN